MPRKGIHPLMRSMTVVLRNGSSFQACTALNRKTPWKMQMVRGGIDGALVVYYVMGSAAG